MALRAEKNGQSIASRKLLVKLTCYIHYANHIPQIHRITPRTIANSKSYSVLVYLFVSDLNCLPLPLFSDINCDPRQRTHITRVCWQPLGHKMCR